MALPQRLLRLTFAIALSIMILSILFLCPLNIPQDPLIHFSNWADEEAKTGPGNRTLGFEKILVVSPSPSWRIDGLLKAAAFTSLSVSISKQPKWTAQQVDTFRHSPDPNSKSKIGPGQARCWMGHLHAIQQIVSSQYSSALILEDDADWDINIKSQLTLVAPHIRAITNSTVNDDERLPYGNQWDLLWLGHCGDVIPENKIAIHDPTLPLTARYRENDGSYITITPLHQTRIVQISQTPFCTYGYGLTLPASNKILNYINSTKGNRDIITTELRGMCQSGELKCVTVNPELFHHHKKAGKVSSEIARVEGWGEMSRREERSFTANIRWSARCNSKYRRGGRLVSCQDKFGRVGEERRS